MKKKQLNEMGKNNRLHGRENYKKELNNTLEKLKQRANESKTDKDTLMIV